MAVGHRFGPGRRWRPCRRPGPAIRIPTSPHSQWTTGSTSPLAQQDGPSTSTTPAPALTAGERDGRLRLHPGAAIATEQDPVAGPTRAASNRAINGNTGLRLDHAWVSHRTESGARFDRGAGAGEFGRAQPAQPSKLSEGLGVRGDGRAAVESMRGGGHSAPWRQPGRCTGEPGQNGSNLSPNETRRSNVDSNPVRSPIAAHRE
jgi:hypothetical protein